MNKYMQLTICICICFDCVSAESNVLSTISRSHQRVLHFPVDYSLGYVYIEDEKIEHRIQTTVVDADGSEWKYLSQAKGDVIIPAGHRVELIMAGEVWDEPKRSADLERLGPDDIYTLILSPYRTPGKEKMQMDACLPHIASLAGLRELILTRTRISTGALKSLVNLKNLKKLGAPGGLTHGGLGEIVKIKSLKSLHIADNQLTDKSILLLQQLPQLEELSIYSVRLTNQSLEYIAQLPRLTYLSLANRFSNAGMAHLQKSSSLKILQIHFPDFNNEGMKYVSQIPQLERFDVHNIEKITDQGIFYFSNHKNLKSLESHHAKLTDLAFVTLGQMSRMEYLLLPDSGFTDDGIENLSKLKNLKFLWVGAASNSPLTDQSLLSIAKLSSLEKLHIGCKEISDQGMAKLAHLNHLSLLSLLTNHITEQGMQSLAALKNLEDFTLYLKDPVSVDGVNCLNQMSCLKKIKIYKVKKEIQALNLSGLKNLETLRLIMDSIPDRKLQKMITTSFLEDEDMTCLAGMKNLNALVIDGVKISDIGFRTVAGIKSLQEIWFTGPTQIGDKGLDFFPSDSTIWYLHIDYGQFTEKCLSGLEKLENLNRLELTSDTAFDSKSVAEFKKLSKIQKIVLKP